MGLIIKLLLGVCTIGLASAFTGAELKDRVERLKFEKQVVFNGEPFWKHKIPIREEVPIDRLTCPAGNVGVCTLSSPLNGEEIVYIAKTDNDYSQLDAKLQGDYLQIIVYDDTTHKNKDIGLIRTYIGDFQSTIDTSKLPTGFSNLPQSFNGETLVVNSRGDGLLNMLTEGYVRFCHDRAAFKDLSQKITPTAGKWGTRTSDGYHILYGFTYPGGYLQLGQSAKFSFTDGFLLDTDFTIQNYQFRMQDTIYSDVDKDRRITVGRGHDKNGQNTINFASLVDGPRQLPVQFEEATISFIPQVHFLLERLNLSNYHEPSLKQNLENHLGVYNEPELLNNLLLDVNNCERCVQMFSPRTVSIPQYPFSLREIETHVTVVPVEYLKLEYRHSIIAQSATTYQENIGVVAKSQYFKLLDSVYTLNYTFYDTNAGSLRIDFESDFLKAKTRGSHRGKTGSYHSIFRFKIPGFASFDTRIHFSSPTNGFFMLDRRGDNYMLQLNFDTLGNVTTWTLTDWLRGNKLTTLFTVKTQIIEDKVYVTNTDRFSSVVESIFNRNLKEFKENYQTLADNRKIEEIISQIIGDVDFRIPKCNDENKLSLNDVGPIAYNMLLKQKMGEKLNLLRFGNLNDILKYVLSAINPNNKLDTGFINDKSLAINPLKIAELITQMLEYSNKFLEVGYYSSNVAKYESYLRLVNHPTPHAQAKEIETWGQQNMY